MHKWGILPLTPANFLGFHKLIVLPTGSKPPELANKRPRLARVQPSVDTSKNKGDITKKLSIITSALSKSDFLGF